MWSATCGPTRIPCDAGVGQGDRAVGGPVPGVRHSVSVVRQRRARPGTRPNSGSFSQFVSTVLSLVGQPVARSAGPHLLGKADGHDLTRRSSPYPRPCRAEHTELTGCIPWRWSSSARRRSRLNRVEPQHLPEERRASSNLAGGSAAVPGTDERWLTVYNAAGMTHYSAGRLVGSAVGVLELAQSCTLSRVRCGRQGVRFCGRITLG